VEGTPLAGLAIISCSGLVNASFPLPMKYAREWKWENLWFVFSFWALVLLPVCAAVSVVPNLWRVYSALSLRDFLPGAVFGLFWGFAQVSFGVAVPMVGMAMAFAIVAGMCAVLGSLIPMMVLHPQDLLGVGGAALLISSIVLGVGLVQYVRAARERDLATAGESITSPGSASYQKGLLLCLFTGATAPMINLGFAFSGKIAAGAVTSGASERSATLAIWIIVLGAAAIPNLLSPAYLFSRNKSLIQFSQSPLKGTLLAAFMGVLWTAGTLGYGWGAATMGRYGVSIGYAVYVVILVLWSTITGLFTGEWRAAAPPTLRRMRLGLVFIVLAVLIVSAAGLA
jgi:L-rhamnose-H+ transport protein